MPPTQIVLRKSVTGNYGSERQVNAEAGLCRITHQSRASPLVVTISESSPAATFSAFANRTVNCFWFPCHLKVIPEKVFFCLVERVLED